MICQAEGCRGEVNKSVSVIMNTGHGYHPCKKCGMLHHRNGSPVLKKRWFKKRRIFISEEGLLAQIQKIREEKGIMKTVTHFIRY